MDYISCESAAKKIGVSTRRIQQMCKQKEIVVEPGVAGM